MPDTTVRASGAATDQDDQGADQAAPKQPVNSLADEGPADTKEDPMVALAREAADYRDKLLRSLAATENLRKRTQRQVAEARHYGIADLARDTLAVAPNMDTALADLDTALAAEN